MEIPPSIAVAPTMPARTLACGASHSYYKIMSESLRVFNEAGNKEKIIHNLQESIVDDMDFRLCGITGNICPGWE